MLPYGIRKVRSSKFEVGSVKWAPGRVSRRQGGSMRIGLVATLLCGLCSGTVDAQTIAGEWALTLHEQFAPSVMRLSLATNGETLTGSAGGRPIDGTFSAGRIAAKVRDATMTGAFDGAELKGEIVFPDRTVKWTAVRIPPPPSSPKTHVFEPSNSNCTSLRRSYRCCASIRATRYARGASMPAAAIARAHAARRVATRRRVPSTWRGPCRTTRWSSG